MSSLITLTNEQDAWDLMNTYATAMTSPAESPINDWFNIGQTRIRGFVLEPTDFLLLSSYVGLTHLEVHFGLDPQATGQSSPPVPFNLLFRMTNADRSLCSRFHKLTSPLLLTEYPPVSTNNECFDTYNKVPGVYDHIWNQNWSNEVVTIPLNSLKLTISSPGNPVYDATITMYRFQIQDLLNTFYPISIGPNGTPDKDPLLYVYLACHSNTMYPQSANAWGEFDKIGIMFGMTQLDGNGQRVQISSCYDFSAPCPPTCP